MGVIYRDNSIDILRALGLLLIFISHAQPESNTILQLRCFDVPMMVFISGLVSSGKNIIDYKQFILKRSIRLIAPVWIFLSFYFLVLGMFQIFDIIPTYLTYEKIIESYLLLDGIGYVWIIRVFLLIMFVTPYLCRIAEFKNSLFYISILVCLLSTDFLILLISDTNIPAIKFVVNNYLTYILGYSALFILGIKLRFMKGKNALYMILFIFLLFFCVLMFYLYWHGLPVIITPIYKFPPRTYYLVYGIFLSMVLWLTRQYWIYIFDLKLFRFIGRNTIWIYLWHMPFVLLSTQCDNFFLRYIILSCFPITIFYIQNRLVKCLFIPDSIKKIFVG